MMSDSEKLFDSYSLKNILPLMKEFYPDFAYELVDELVDLLKISKKKNYEKMSKGQKGKFNLIIALASRAWFTLLDETYISLDAPSRHKIFEWILNDYEAFPRTFIISTHYVDEVSRIFEEIILIDQGCILLHDEKDSIESKTWTIYGNTNQGQELLKEKNILSEERLGNKSMFSLFDDIEDIREQLLLNNYDVSVTPLEKWFVHTINKGGNND
jgi:ABC-2 type transport system ATP-binding protein